MPTVFPHCTRKGKRVATCSLRQEEIECREASYSRSRENSDCIGFFPGAGMNPGSNREKLPVSYQTSWIGGAISGTVAHRGWIARRKGFVERLVEQIALVLPARLVVERMPREVRGCVGACRHHAPAVLARRIERLARELSGDATTLDGAGNLGVGDGHDVGGERVIEDRALTIQGGGEAMRCDVVIDFNHGEMITRSHGA
jgi:hypothetical protein